MRAMLLGIALAGATVLSCGSTRVSPTKSPATHALAATEVVQRFLDWVCPGSPVIANSTFKPVASPMEEVGIWQIATEAGIYTFREPSREVMPSSEMATTYANTSRAQVLCQPRASGGGY